MRAGDIVLFERMRCEVLCIGVSSILLLIPSHANSPYGWPFPSEDNPDSKDWWQNFSVDTETKYIKERVRDVSHPIGCWVGKEEVEIFEVDASTLYTIF